jgi:hypothetical protein
VHIRHNDGIPFQATVSESIPDALYAFNDTTTHFSLLPARGWAGFKLRVKADPEDDRGDYYIRFVPSTEGQEGFTDGSWEETLGWNVYKSLDPATMPLLIKDYGTYFQITHGPWEAIQVGDNESNPWPDFMYASISAIFLYRNRLGLCSGPNVSLIESGEYFNFFRTTVVASLDADPMLLTAAHVKPVDFHGAAVSAETLLLLTSKGQFVLSSDGPLSLDADVETQAHNNHLRDAELARFLEYAMGAPSPQGRRILISIDKFRIND